MPSIAIVGGSLRESRFARFLLVGLLNTLVGYLLYYSFLMLGAAPGMALAVATVIGAVFNYFSTGRMVFRHGKLNRLPLFLAAYLVIYLGNLALLHGLIVLGIPANYAQLLLLPIVAIASFLMFKFVVFRVRT